MRPFIEFTSSHAGRNAFRPYNMRPEPRRAERLPPLPDAVGILVVQFPLQRIVDDVLPRLTKPVVIANDSFEIVPLPYGAGGCSARGIDSLGRCAFESRDERSEGSGCAVKTRRIGRGRIAMCGRIAMRPYRNNEDKAVDVIRHEHEFVQFNLGTNLLRPNHSSMTASPTAFACIAPSRISPNAVFRSWVHNVTKYTPACV